MAPVLLCPECGAKHPLDGVGGSAFPCKGCGRTLRVPKQVPAAAGVGAKPGADSDLPWPQAGTPDAPQTRSLPTTTTPPPGPPPASGGAAASRPAPRRARPRDPVPGRAIRFSLWIVAVPLGFMLVFGFAQVIGVLTSNQLEDVALDEGWARFMPIARLLPFVALAIAGIVQLSVYAITRLRTRRLGARVPERRPAT
jgi:hypothetical protein